MNRRSFLMGGGLIGAVTALVATAKEEARLHEELAPCEAHVPDEDYLKAPAFAMTHVSSPEIKALVPCKKCGALFALTMRPDAGMIGIAARGAPKK